jgi:hypothetical protein
MKADRIGREEAEWLIATKYGDHWKDTHPVEWAETVELIREFPNIVEASDYLEWAMRRRQKMTLAEKWGVVFLLVVLIAFIVYGYLTHTPEAPYQHPFR